MWRSGVFLVAACLVASSGCLCQGICTKRENELCCPTDIRKTHFWCFGEDAIFHGPCGPKEELYGLEPTCWREWPAPGTDWSGAPFRQPAESIMNDQTEGRGGPSQELPEKSFAPKPPDAPQTDLLPANQSNESQPPRSLNVAEQSQRVLQSPVESTTTQQSNAMKTLAAGPGPSIQQLSVADGAIQRVCAIQRQPSREPQLPAALMVQGPPLVENGITPAELERRRRAAAQLQQLSGHSPRSGLAAHEELPAAMTSERQPLLEQQTSATEKERRRVAAAPPQRPSRH
jgi:hypothetical protein